MRDTVEARAMLMIADECTDFVCMYVCMATLLPRKGREGREPPFLVTFRMNLPVRIDEP